MFFVYVDGQSVMLPAMGAYATESDDIDTSVISAQSSPRTGFSGLTPGVHLIEASQIGLAPSFRTTQLSPDGLFLVLYGRGIDEVTVGPTSAIDLPIL